MTKQLPRLVLCSVFVFCSIWFGRADFCGGYKIAQTITVGGQSSVSFQTIQAAIDSIAQYNAEWVKIHIYPGTYTEKVQIPLEKPCIFLEGEGRGVTIITYNDHDETDTSATFSAFPDSVIAKGITFRNTFNLEQPRRRNEVKPALAARIYGDKSAFFECGFEGLQDTLWDVQGRHYFLSCYIEGAVDFIFGNGRSYYEDCTVNATMWRLGPEITWSYITAQGRQTEKEVSGFVFRGGSVVGSDNRQVMLGRAYGPYSTVIFHETYMDSVVKPQGWDAWNYRGRDATLLYAEVNCQGPGSDTSGRVSWEKKLSAEQIDHFSRSYFIDQDNWISQLP